MQRWEATPDMATIKPNGRKTSNLSTVYQSEEVKNGDAQTYSTQCPVVKDWALMGKCRAASNRTTLY